MSADEMVINMVNAPHERQKQLLAKSRAAKRLRRQKAQMKARRADVINTLLRFAVVLELAVIALSVGFIIMAQ